MSKGDKSYFHRICSDEMWHFYQGDPLILHEITRDGKYSHTQIGPETLQYVVRAGNWFAAQSLGEFSFLGCTVSPGFDFVDFELAKKGELIKLCPAQSKLIEKFTLEH